MKNLLRYGSRVIPIGVGTFLLFICLAKGYAKYTPAPENLSARSDLLPKDASQGGFKLYGLNFGPFIGNEDPRDGTGLTIEKIRNRIALVAPFTARIRTFSCTGGLENAGRIAHELGMKAALGAWIGKDPMANEREITNLIRAARSGQADIAIVGSEVLLRKDLSEDDLIAYIHRVKQAAPAVTVTTADVYSELLAHPKVTKVCDVVFANFYPYWEGIRIEHAIAALHRRYEQLKTSIGDKPLTISETGWPDGGNAVGESVASPRNAGYYFLNFASWVRSNKIPSYYYFEAMDNPWKTNEGPQGAHFGLLHASTLKPGMKEVFDGATMQDNWSGTTLVEGMGRPRIEFTEVPTRGSNKWLKGKIGHVKPADYRIAVYIFVDGSGWWTKPTLAEASVIPWPDGEWQCNIVTGGNDSQASRIAAFLIPKDFPPPILTGQMTIPEDIGRKAVAMLTVSR